MIIRSVPYSYLFREFLSNLKEEKCQDVARVERRNRQQKPKHVQVEQDYSFLLVEFIDYFERFTSSLNDLVINAV